jgi:hypothetical protein
VNYLPGITANSQQLAEPLTDAERQRRALIGFFASQGGTFFIVAELPPPAGRAALEDTLYHWIARMNRLCNGPRWWKPDRRHLRMTGFVTFETRGNLHAHLIVRPPRGANPHHFWPDAELMWNELVPGGTLKIKSVWGLPGAASYVTKDLTWTKTDGDAWMFIEDLSKKSVRTA